MSTGLNVGVTCSRKRNGGFGAGTVNTTGRFSTSGIERFTLRPPISTAPVGSDPQAPDLSRDQRRANEAAPHERRAQQSHGEPAAPLPRSRVSAERQVSGGPAVAVQAGHGLRQAQRAIDAVESR